MNKAELINAVAAAAEVSKKDAEGVVSANARVDITVTNTPSFKLPMTGGTGALICTLTGCAAAFGGILIATKRGKKNEDKDQ